MRGPEARRARSLLLSGFWNDGEHTHGSIAGGRCCFHTNGNGDTEPCAFARFATGNIRRKGFLEVLRSPLPRAFKTASPSG
jgi:MoaA/NifB/PqqE/SkfB family radical SAM enzyme